MLAICSTDLIESFINEDHDKALGGVSSYHAYERREFGSKFRLHIDCCGLLWRFNSFRETGDVEGRCLDGSVIVDDNMSRRNASRPSLQSIKDRNSAKRSSLTSRRLADRMYDDGFRVVPKLKLRCG